MLILLGLGSVLAFIAGPVGFFLTLGARRRLDETEARVRVLAETLDRQIARLDARISGADGTQAPSPIRPAVAPEAAGPQAEVDRGTTTNLDELVVPDEIDWAEAKDARPAAPEPAQPDSIAAAQAAPLDDLVPDADVPFDLQPASEIPAAPPVAARSLEETLGTRWTVWVGGLALALGAILLVRYSIEAGFFGPAARLFMGLLLSAATIGAGEYLRRRERAGAEFLSQSTPTAHIPGMLTAVGTIAAFGVVYAAHALYGFIDTGIAFVAMAAIGIATMVAAALHGPPLAAIGLIGALAAPLLVQSASPNPWPVLVLVTVVTGVAYALARLRDWLWLALAGAAGAGLWGIIYAFAIPGAGSEFLIAGLILVSLQIAMAAYIFVFATHPADSEEPGLDKPAHLVLGGFALVTLLMLASGSMPDLFGANWMIGAIVTGGLLVATGLARRQAAGVAAFGALLGLAALRLWPGAGPIKVFKDNGADLLKVWLQPIDLAAFAIFAVAVALLPALAAGWALMRRAAGNALSTWITAGVAVLTPLGALSLAYLRLGEGQPSAGIAASGLALGAAFVVAAGSFRNRATPDAPVATAALGAYAAGAIAALALALVFALEGGLLTVALAIAALGSAYVSDRLNLKALRWMAAALAFAIAGRLAWDPRIVGSALGTTPIFNWLLFGYGVPALAFFASARIMLRRADDMPARIADSAALVFAAFLAFFEIRHFMNSGDPFARSSALVEQALLSVSGLGFALVLNRLESKRANIVFRIGSFVFAGGGAALAIFGLVVFFNPVLTDTALEGSRLFNSLILAYLIPGLMAVALGVFTRATRPWWYWGIATGLGAALTIFFVFAEVRVLLHGMRIGLDRGVFLSESGIDSVLCLLAAIGLTLAAHTTRHIIAVRLAEVTAGVAGLFALLGSLLIANPVLTDAPTLLDGTLMNALLVGYGIPAGLSLLLARRARLAGLERLHVGAMLGAIVLLFVYATFQTRRIFAGPDIGLSTDVSQGELYAYSAVWLGLGIIMLAYGIWRASREMRLASAVFVFASVGKIFLIDLAGLEGALRALSFIGLGAVLIGIGLVYQKLVFASRASPPSTAAPAPPNLESSQN